MNSTTVISSVVVALCVYFWMRVFPAAPQLPAPLSLPGNLKKSTDKKKKKKKPAKQLNSASSNVPTSSAPETETETEYNEPPVRKIEPTAPMIEKKILKEETEVVKTPVQKNPVSTQPKKQKGRNRGTDPDRILSVTEFPPLSKSSQTATTDSGKSSTGNAPEKNVIESKSEPSKSSNKNSPLMVPDDEPSNVRLQQIIAEKELADYSPSEGEQDDGWQMVDMHPKSSKTLRIVSSSSTTAKPSAPVRVISKPAEMTKTQRKNLLRKEKERLLKEAEKQAQEERLLRYRREQERETIEKLAQQEKQKQIQRQLSKNIDYRPAISTSKPVFSQKRSENVNTFESLESTSNKDANNKRGTAEDAGDLWG